jgi:hypothetical protein
MKEISKLITINKEGYTKTLCNLNDYTQFIDESHIAVGYNKNGKVVFSKNTDSLLYTLYSKATDKNKSSVLKNSKFLIKLEKIVMDGEELNLGVSTVKTWNQFKKFEELEKNFEQIIKKHISNQKTTVH